MWFHLRRTRRIHRKPCSNLHSMDSRHTRHTTFPCRRTRRNGRRPACRAGLRDSRGRHSCRSTRRSCLASTCLAPHPDNQGMHPRPCKRLQRRAGFVATAALEAARTEQPMGRRGWRTAQVDPRVTEWLAVAAHAFVMPVAPAEHETIRTPVESRN